MRHDIYATFMANPYERNRARPCTSTPERDRRARQEPLRLQGRRGHAPLPRLYRRASEAPAGGDAADRAPYVNSYRRLVRFLSAPDQHPLGPREHTVGLRIPESSPQSRRVREPCRGPTPIPIWQRSPATASPAAISAWRTASTRPGDGRQRLRLHPLPCRATCSTPSPFRASSDLREIFGDAFVDLYSDVRAGGARRRHQQVISPGSASACC